MIIFFATISEIEEYILIIEIIPKGNVFTVVYSKNAEKNKWII